jgi:hypothetical protein
MTAPNIEPPAADPFIELGVANSTSIDVNGIEEAWVRAGIFGGLVVWGVVDEDPVP